jgi:hypothetical protein
MFTRAERRSVPSASASPLQVPAYALTRPELGSECPLSRQRRPRSAVGMRARGGAGTLSRAVPLVLPLRTMAWLHQRVDCNERFGRGCASSTPCRALPAVSRRSAAASAASSTSRNRSPKSRAKSFQSLPGCCGSNGGTSTSPPMAPAAASALIRPTLCLGRPSAPISRSR